MTDYLRGFDAAFPEKIPQREEPILISGYFGGPQAYNVWPAAAWAQFPGKDFLLPIWVGGLDGPGEGAAALAALRALGVPDGCEMMLDLEARIDRTYVEHFGAVVQQRYKVLPYGSASTIFENPQLNGYAVADPTGSEHMYPHPGVRLTQWKFGRGYDRDAVKPWLAVAGDFWQR